MTFLTELIEKAQALSGRAALDVEPGQLLHSVRRIGDDELLGLVAAASELQACAERLTVVGAAVIAERSTRGHGGLAGTRGHRSPVTLIQEITGGTRTEASRTMRVGASLLDDDGGSGSSGSSVDEEAPFVWHGVVREAMLAGRISTAAHDAIRRGLGDPIDREGAPQVWATAAAELVHEAAILPVEQLGQRARMLRDSLDPVGAENRHARQYEGRSWRTWVDADGVEHARVQFDAEGAAWFRAVRDSALRPRRGGPRFMTDAERAAAADLVADPRTNDQLLYDLMMDLLRVGALAEAEEVFGARQPGVRVITVADPTGPRDAFGRLQAIGYLEGAEAVPGSVLDRTLCDKGVKPLSFDALGNPLDVGREQRLFTASQRIAMAARDGGCVIPGCDRPPAYCESHHIDEWVADQGRTDIDRGVLLCMFHHLGSHNLGWKITRDGRGPFLLHIPGRDDPIPLRSNAQIRWLWDPPPRGPGWRGPGGGGGGPGPGSGGSGPGSGSAGVSAAGPPGGAAVA